MPRHNLFLIVAVVLFGIFAALHLSIPDRVFRDAVRVVERESLEEVDEEELVEGALDGMMSRSPYYPYSAYLPPDEEDEYEDEIQGVFAGIGIGHMAVDETSGELWFTPIYGSPAWKAGLRFGERITAIDGGKIDGKSPEEVHDVLSGELGKSVRLSVRSLGDILRRYGGDESGSGEAVREVEVPREMVRLDVVTGYRRGGDGAWIYTLDGNPQIGYIRVDQFTDETVPLFEEALGELDKQGATSLIIDLRGNPGGFLEGASGLCSSFLPKGAEVVTIRSRGGVIDKRVTADGRKKYDWKLVVLIDEESASASEIVAGALADHHRATLVGTRSYGKGTVQALYTLAQGMGMIRLTCASFNRPSGKSIHREADASDDDEWGVAPDAENLVESDDYQRGAATLLADLRSFPPDGADRSEPMTRLIFDRAQKRDLFTPDPSDAPIAETECDFATPESADPQLARAIRILSPEEPPEAEKESPRE